MEGTTTRARPLRFVVVTGSDLESGSTIAYLKETTNLSIVRIYQDTLQQTARKPAATKPAHRWFNNWATFRRHLGLLAAMPRHYAFRALGKFFGMTEIKFLYWIERLSPRLLDAACGFALPVRQRRGRLLRRLADVAAQYDIPLVRTPSPNSAATIADITADAPDVVLGLGTRILSAKLLATARLGFLNAHSSLLPEYRGGVTEFWQLANGERETGVTIHWMAPRVDEGPICAQRSWPIPRGFDHHRLRLMSFFYRLDLWREVVERLQAGEIPMLQQRTARTPTFKSPTMEELFDFYCRGGQSLVARLSRAGRS